MECCCCLRNVQDLVPEGETLHDRRFGKPCKGPLIPFGAMVEYHPISAREKSRFHQIGKKVLPGIFLGYALNAGRILKGDVLVSDSKVLEELRASEKYPRRINQKEVLISQEGEELMFPVADGTAQMSRRDYEFREPTRGSKP